MCLVCLLVGRPCCVLRCPVASASYDLCAAAVLAPTHHRTHTNNKHDKPDKLRAVPGTSSTKRELPRDWGPRVHAACSRQQLERRVEGGGRRRRTTLHVYQADTAGALQPRPGPLMRRAERMERMSAARFTQSAPAALAREESAPAVALVGPDQDFSEFDSNFACAHSARKFPRNLPVCILCVLGARCG